MLNAPEAADLEGRWMAAMRKGDLPAAWAETDRLELPRRERESAGRFRWEPDYLLWNGSPWAGRRLLVRCNHGLGDTLQFCRYLPGLSREAAALTVLVQPPLVPLLAGMPGFGQVRNGWTEEPPPEHDVELEIMELAYAFRSTLETLPRRMPYLCPEVIRARAGPLILPPRTTGKRIGLLWAASDWDPSRSVGLKTLECLSQVEGCQFFSLQQGRQRDDELTSALPLHPLSRQTESLGQAAAAMLEMDLIITVDSMAAHLAGALGRPVWVLLKQHADWRWMSNRTDSPWYPTMRLFRQPAEGDWRAVAEAVKEALRQERFTSATAPDSESSPRLPPPL